MIGRWCGCPPTELLSFRPRVCHPRTRIYVRLLGPCFKTGGKERICQRPETLSLGPGQGTERGLNTASSHLPAHDFPNPEPTLTPVALQKPRGNPTASVAFAPFPSLSAISSPFHTPSEALFIFPSQYLFAIGLLLIFSFRWNLPPT